MSANSNTPSSIPLIVAMTAIIGIGFISSIPPDNSNNQSSGIAKMMQDPEAKTIEWEEEVNAMSEGIAKDKCRRIAERYASNGGYVRLISVRRIGNAFYKCKFMGEDRDAQYDDESTEIPYSPPAGESLPLSLP